MDAEILKKVELFEGLTSQQIEQLAAISEDREVEPGTVLFEEGDVGDELYVILKGKVRISKFVAGVGEEALAILEPGAYFGEMALINDHPRTAHAICNTSVKLGVIRREAFEQVLFLNKDLAYELLWRFVRTLSDRLGETNDKIKAFFAMSGRF
ncbi:MAG: cyclic nucleotide-binding domain-containing protein [Deltaproteobacteria bacterium]|nr:cyclic nucleotide-binding domain-containing protein [Deltaproteobacteria bacterium]